MVTPMNELENRERLVRLETKVDTVLEYQRRHEERHYQFNLRALFALIGAGLALIVSFFKG